MTTQTLRLIVLAVLVSAVILAIVFLRDSLSQFLDQSRNLGWLGAMLLVLIYVGACVLMMPGSVLTLSAGAVFGVGIALPITLTGATLGACAAFLVGRFIARDWISRRLAGKPRLAAIDRAVGHKGFTIVLLTRLSPIFPFNVQNYAYALTGISFWKYALATWLGMIPGALMYVYIGSVFGQAARGEKTAAEWTLYSIGLAASVLAAIVIARIARNALARVEEGQEA